MSGHEEQDRYPVIIEETVRHVVWIEADSAEKAAQSVYCGDLNLDTNTCYWVDQETRIPDAWDWRDIERPSGDGGWRGMRADAHVQTYRNRLQHLKQQEDRAACTAAGHPVPAGATGPARWADQCGTCGQIDPASRTAVAS